MTPTAGCDLCSRALRGRWHRFDAHEAAPTLQARRMGTGIAVVGHWAACPDCARLIGKQAFDTLADRVAHHTGANDLRDDERVQARYDVAEVCTSTLPVNLTGPRAGRRAGPGWKKRR